MSKQQNLSRIGFLIDEDLTHELADMATARGFPAFAVTRMVKLRARGDHIISRYAVDRELILVTNNLVDFERIYQAQEYHPGLVFICGPTKLRTKYYQRLMMEHALSEIERECLLQEALCVTTRRDKGDVLITLERYNLPEISAGGSMAAQCA